MDESTTVWLIRHGGTIDAEGRCCGRRNVALSAEGIRQAQEVAKYLSGEPISHVYSSGLRRAVDTAHIVAEPHCLHVQAVEALAEMDFGDLEGLRYEQIQQEYPECFESWLTRPAETQFPNGESFTQMSVRVFDAFDLLLSRHRNQSIAVVVHAGVIRMILGKALSIPDNQIFRLAQRHGAINRIRYFEDGPVVELVNG
jgi:alpha-ribazole phosphatase